MCGLGVGGVLSGSDGRLRRGTVVGVSECASITYEPKGNKGYYASSLAYWEWTYTDYRNAEFLVSQGES